MAPATLGIADVPTPDGQVWSDGWVVDPRDDVFRLVLAESEAAPPRACFEDLVLHRGLIAAHEARNRQSVA